MKSFELNLKHLLKTVNIEQGYQDFYVSHHVAEMQEMETEDLQMLDK